MKDFFTNNINTNTLNLNGETTLKVWSDSAEVYVTKDLNNKEIIVNNSITSKAKYYKDFSWVI